MSVAASTLTHSAPDSVRAAAPAPPLVDVRGVTLQYKTKDHLVTATYRVDFQVFRSERFILLGPSGCGKSTLLKAVGGYLQPVEGEIRLKGEVVQRPGPDRMMVFQEFDQLLPVEDGEGERHVSAVRDGSHDPQGGRGEGDARTSTR